MRNISPEAEYLNRDICEHSQLLDDLSLIHLAKNTKGKLRQDLIEQAAGRGIDCTGAWVGFSTAAINWKKTLDEDFDWL
jgi:hypothetical protein